jgi:uncharacterized protein (DUF934 family)
MPDLSELSQSSELSKPSNLIKDNQIVDNDWQIIAKDADFSIDNASGQLLLPLALWLEHAEQLKNSKTIGVWLDSDESPEPLETLCESIPVIGINFPVFADGRGYSYARTLRDYYHYSGDLRAIGDVLNAEKAIAGLNDFSADYQAGSDEGKPIFHKR